MTFDLQLMSDQQLQGCLTKMTKLPSWRLANTQSEREHKRIRLIQQHRQLIAEQELQQKRKRQRIVNQQTQLQTNQRHHKHNRKSIEKEDDGLEL